MVMQRDDDGNGPKVDWEQKLDHSIRETLDDGEMVMRWLTIVEVMDSDGDRMLYSLASPGLQGWEALGMLRYMQAQQEFALQVDTAYVLDHDEEDDE